MVANMCVCLQNYLHYTDIPKSENNTGNQIQRGTKLRVAVFEPPGGNFCPRLPQGPPKCPSPRNPVSQRQLSRSMALRLSLWLTLSWSFISQRCMRTSCIVIPVLLEATSWEEIVCMFALRIAGLISRPTKYFVEGPTPSGYVMAGTRTTSKFDRPCLCGKTGILFIFFNKLLVQLNAFVLLKLGHNVFVVKLWRPFFSWPRPSGTRERC